MNVAECIRKAESLLPGTPARDGQPDARWQAIIAVGAFVESEPAAVWEFARQWGCSEQEDLRSAIATCLVEHLLEHHFEWLFPQLEQVAREDPRFMDTVRMCWEFGQSESPANRDRLARLLGGPGSAS